MDTLLIINIQCIINIPKVGKLFYIENLINSYFTFSLTFPHFQYERFLDFY